MRYYSADILRDGEPTGLELVRIGADLCEVRDRRGDTIHWTESSSLRSAKAEIRRKYGRGE